MRGHLIHPGESEHSYGFESGLLHSLEELALRCAVVAIGVPALVVGVAFLAGHRFFSGPTGGETSQPWLTAGLATYVVIPMIALAGAVSAAIVALAIWWSEAPLGVRAARAGFLVAAGVLGVLVAVTYDGVFLPDLMN